MAKEKGTKDHPWTLKTPPGTSEFTMYKDESISPPVLVCTVGKTVLHYDLRCLHDLHAMLKKHGDWVELGVLMSKARKRGNRGGMGNIAKESHWRVLWSKEGIAWSLWNVYSTINGRAWTCGTRAQSKGY